MMHRLWLVGWVVLIVGAGRMALAQPAPPAAPTGPAPSPAPWLGDAKYTVHLAGSLKNVVDDLAKIVGLQIILPMQNDAGNGEPPKGDVMVKLDFDNTTLDQILLSLCKQAGVVYEPNGTIVNVPGRGGGTIILRVGDPQLDPRPTVAVGDYVVRITDISRQTTLRDNFKWGQAAPNKPDLYASMSLALEVTANSVDAARKLAGLSGHYRAVPDQGAPFESGGNYPAGYYQAMWSPNITGRTLRGAIGLTAPPPEATKLTRLEGTLALYSTVKVTELKVAPDAVGQAFQQDDVSITEKSWKLQGQQVMVELEGTCPALPRKPGANFGSSRETQTAVLVAKDGREVASPGGSRMRDGPPGGGAMKLSFQFTVQQAAQAGLNAPGAGGPAPGAGGPAETTEGPFVVDYLRVTFVRSGDADVTLPFVIENIPLP
jgi:hypothetical protein